MLMVLQPRASSQVRVRAANRLTRAAFSKRTWTGVADACRSGTKRTVVLRAEWAIVVGRHRGMEVVTSATSPKEVRSRRGPDQVDDLACIARAALVAGGRIAWATIVCTGALGCEASGTFASGSLLDAERGGGSLIVTDEAATAVATGAGTATTAGVGAALGTGATGTGDGFGAIETTGAIAGDGIAAIRLGT